MSLTWISKDSITCHYYIGASSICRSQSLIEPFSKKYSNGSTQNQCKICSGILKSNHKEIKIKEKRLEIKNKLFAIKYGISPVDALVNLINHKETCQDNPLESVSAKDFGGISPRDVLAEAIKENKIGFKEGLICPLEAL